MSFDRERHKLNPGLERKVVGMKMVHNIFLVAGQSNTDGRVMSSDRNAPSYLNDNIVNNVRVWNGVGLHLTVVEVLISPKCRNSAIKSDTNACMQ